MKLKNQFEHLIPTGDISERAWKRFKDDPDAAVNAIQEFADIIGGFNQKLQAKGHEDAQKELAQIQAMTPKERRAKADQMLSDLELSLRISIARYEQERGTT